MKRRLILPVILLSLAVLSGCGKKTEAPEDRSGRGKGAAGSRRRELGDCAGLYGSHDHQYARPLPVRECGQDGGRGESHLVLSRGGSGAGILDDGRGYGI